VSAATWAVMGIVFGWIVHARLFNASPSKQSGGAAIGGGTNNLRQLIRGFWMAGLDDRHLCPSLGVTKDSAEPAKPISGARYNILSLVVCIFISIIITVAVLRDFGINEAYVFEDWLVRSRSVWVMLWGVIGVLASHYRKILKIIIVKLFLAFLGKGHPSPWAFQAALSILVLCLALLALRPDMLDRMIERVQSVRAGDMEAKFAEASNRIHDASGVMNVSGLHARETISQWDRFEYLNTPIKDKYPNDDLLTPRLMIYKINGEPIERYQISSALFLRYIDPAIAILNSLRKIRDTEFDYYRNNRLLKMISRDAAALVSKHRIDRKTDMESLKELLENISEFVDILRSRIKRIAPGELENNDSLKAAIGLFKTGHIDGESSLYYKAYLRTDIEKIFNVVESNPSIEDIWDPYLVSAVADLIAFCGRSSDKAEFLEKHRDRYIFDKYKMPHPGYINYYYQLVDSKINSEIGYDAEVMFHDIERNISAIDEILVSTNLRRGIAEEFQYGAGVWSKMDATYRRNRLQSSGSALRILVQQAISGTAVSNYIKDRGVNIYRQTLQAISAIEGFDAYVSGPDANERIRWSITKKYIYEKDPEVLQETAMWAAISAVLLPDQSAAKSPTGNCASARFLIGVANSHELQARINDPAGIAKSARDSAALAALSRGINERIELACGK
jgi:hypothetical protein